MDFEDPREPRPGIVLAALRRRFVRTRLQEQCGRAGWGDAVKFPLDVRSTIGPFDPSPLPLRLLLELLVSPKRMHLQVYEPPVEVIQTLREEDYLPSG